MNTTLVGNDKANFYIRLITTIPDSSWLKADIQDWLSLNGKEYANSETKTQLLEKIND